VAPPAVYEVAPGLGEFTDNVLFGEVWVREELAPRHRSLDNGMTPASIGETITQLAFYSGWPNAISAVGEVKKVFDERKLGPVGSSEAARVELETAAEAARKAAVDGAVAPTAPALAELTNRVLFGDLWRRPELAPRDRSLVTMASLIAIGQPEQLPFHVNRAADNGLSRGEIAEAVAHIAFYAGWPRAMSAVPVLQRVFADREQRTKPAPAADRPTELRIVRAAGASSTPGPAERFTGEVMVSGNYRGDEPARIGGATVTFSAGARTAWHTHPLGQTLFIVSGKGWIQKEGGPIEVMLPGDVVWIPPNVRHWHGASADQAMSHFAIAEALDGNVVTWMELVDDEIYRAGPLATGGDPQ